MVFTPLLALILAILLSQCDESTQSTQLDMRVVVLGMTLLLAEEKECVGRVEENGLLLLFPGVDRPGARAGLPQSRPDCAPG
jgi:hypothetical protein